MLDWSAKEVAAVLIAAAIPIFALSSFNIDPNDILCMRQAPCEATVVQGGTRHFFAADAYKYMIVGLLWGVTNPLLRQGR